MIDIPTWCRRITQDLAEADAKFAVVGGLAIAIRAEPRFTRDIDLALAVADDPQAERILRTLILKGYRPLAEMDRNDRPRLATMRMIPPGHTLDEIDRGEATIIDLLFACCGIEEEVVATAEPLVVVADVIAPVAQIPHLLAMKCLSHGKHRPLDLVDIQSLILRATIVELSEARRLVKLIESRRFNDRRPLSTEFERYIKRFRRQS